MPMPHIVRGEDSDDVYDNDKCQSYLGRKVRSFGTRYRVVNNDTPDGQSINAVFLRGMIVAECTGNILFYHTLPNSQGNIAISPDMQCLAIPTHFQPYTIELIDLWTDKLQLSLESSSSRRSYNVPLSFSPDGQLLATADDSRIILWDLHAREKPQVLRVGQIADHEMVFSVDGSRLITSRGAFALPGISDVPTNLAVIKEWFTWKMARVLWIPYEFRSLKFLVAGNVVVFLTPSGLPINWIELDPSTRPTDEASASRFTWEDLADYKTHKFDTSEGRTEGDRFTLEFPTPE